MYSKKISLIRHCHSIQKDQTHSHCAYRDRDICERLGRVIRPNVLGVGVDSAKAAPSHFWIYLFRLCNQETRANNLTKSRIIDCRDWRGGDDSVGVGVGVGVGVRRAVGVQWIIRRCFATIQLTKKTTAKRHEKIEY